MTFIINLFMDGQATKKQRKFLCSPPIPQGATLKLKAVPKLQQREKKGGEGRTRERKKREDTREIRE